MVWKKILAVSILSAVDGSLNDLSLAKQMIDKLITHLHCIFWFEQTQFDGFIAV